MTGDTEQQAPEEPYPDEDGHCIRCGLLWEEDELSGVLAHLCPPGFLTPIVRQQAPDGERCRSFKQGEYNPLECCMPKGHDGEHNYVVKQQAPGLDWDAASRKMIEQAQQAPERGTPGCELCGGMHFGTLVCPFSQHPALHASAPSGYKCADCTMDLEPCPVCYQAWWQKRHPETNIVAAGDTELASSQHGYKLLAEHAEKQAAALTDAIAHQRALSDLQFRTATELTAPKQRLEAAERIAVAAKAVRAVMDGRETYWSAEWDALDAALAAEPPGGQQEQGDG